MQPLLLSLRVAATATLITALLGIGIARALAGKPAPAPRRAAGGAWARFARAWSFRRRDLLATLVDLPLVLPPTVVGFGLLLLLGRQWAPGRFLQDRLGLSVLFTWGAAVLASVIMSLPLMVRTARAAFEAVPERYGQAARVSGAGEWTVFRTVTLPLARRGVAAGIVLAFCRALGEFGATLMVAGNIPGRTQTLPLSIYSAVFEGRPRDAMLQALLVTLVAFAGAAVVHFRLAPGGRGEG
jgi:molybdate transport system permease protein